GEGEQSVPCGSPENSVPCGSLGDGVPCGSLDRGSVPCGSAPGDSASRRLDNVLQAAPQVRGTQAARASHPAPQEDHERAEAQLQEADPHDESAPREFTSRTAAKDHTAGATSPGS
ncbi:MAG: hypothetical protein ACK56F_30860, partial [bacterium]